MDARVALGQLERGLALILAAVACLFLVPGVALIGLGGWAAVDGSLHPEGYGSLSTFIGGVMLVVGVVVTALAAMVVRCARRNRPAAGIAGVLLGLVPLSAAFIDGWAGMLGLIVQIGLVLVGCSVLLLGGGLIVAAALATLDRSGR